MEPQKHKDINDLIAEKKQKEHQEKLDEELRRQRQLLQEKVVPFLNNLSITSAKVLINNTLKTLNTLFEEKMQEERKRLSSTTLENLDIPERLERDEKLQQQSSLVDKIKTETIGTATGVLGALHVAIAGLEAKENSQRNVAELKLDI